MVDQVRRVKNYSKECGVDLQEAYDMARKNGTIIKTNLGSFLYYIP